jgi:hypothetical protein
MAGGIAIALVVILLIVAVVVGVVLYLGGGILWWGKTSPSGDKVEGSEQQEPRPQHRTVSSPTLEHTYFGARADDRDDE